MQALLKVPDPTPGHLLVLLAPHAADEMMLTITARLAQRGALRVMDGGNRFNAYKVARMLRRLGVEALDQALARVHVARAFTCYQMVTLLEQAAPQAAPTLVIDMLNTFYDESVPLGERRRLLESCLGHLRRISAQAAVVVSVRPPRPPDVDVTGMQQRVQSWADQVWFQEEVLPVEQPRLF